MKKGIIQVVYQGVQVPGNYSGLSVHQQHTMSCSLIHPYTAFILSHNVQVFAMSTGTLCETTETYSMLKLGFGLQENMHLFCFAIQTPQYKLIKHAKIDGIELQNQ